MKHILWTVVAVVVLAAIAVGWWVTDGYGLIHSREGVIPPDKLGIDRNWRDPPLPERTADPNGNPNPIRLPPVKQ
jgi:hypothetical protein